ncbi:hypothetical protein CSB37_02775 [bacterium DOLZORAL124_38_8]|nr:MAG: hypothetical protein CSB37_02775 [bacterium DOLZORAL124_38_8]
MNNHLQNGVNTTADKASGGLAQFFSDFISALPLWIAAIVVMVVAYFFAKFIKNIVGNRLAMRQLNQEIIILGERAAFTITLTLGVVISFKIVNINLDTLIGFMGLGIGFALQDILSNFFAGVLILTQNKFKIGDIIRLEDIMGTIEEIDARTTQIRSFDGTSLVIPNAKMINAIVENYTMNTFRRVNLEVGVHYSTDLPKAIALTLESVKKNPQVVPNPEVQVWATKFDDSAITLAVKFWVESTDNRFAIKSQVMQQLKADYDAAGIEIPFPIRTLALDQSDRNLMQALHLPVKK